MGQVSISERVKRDEFLRRLKREWALLRRERFDDRVKAEGVAARDYPSLFMNSQDLVYDGECFG